MGRTSEDEAKEQESNKDLQGDHHKGAQKVGHGVSPSEADAGTSEKPGRGSGGAQQGGGRGH